KYKDFITFFPNMPEAAEAQLKVANIHYRQMEKPDRDYTHARRAEDEYRQLILQFPDSKLVPQAEQRLREVQEVLAEREFRIGRFYYMRESWMAAIARLKTVADSYPLYSNADEALYMIGSAYEHEIDLVRHARGMNEVRRGRTIIDFTNRAAEAYSWIITRYPVRDRAGDAKKRLQALNRPAPKSAPAPAASPATDQSAPSDTGIPEMQPIGASDSGKTAAAPAATAAPGAAPAAANAVSPAPTNPSAATTDNADTPPQSQSQSNGDSASKSPDSSSAQASQSDQ